MEGVLALGGPNIRSGEKIEANIVDITPTTLAALGLRVPVDMEGRVICEAFSTKPIVEQEPPVAKIPRRNTTPTPKRIGGRWRGD